uniref:Uncharacterized protein n=1 Tax=Geladintestivirus 4 TaxID=3233136 RepID=A0AAU8MHN7_9CAUD
MNLNAYDNITETVDKNKTWFNPKYRRLYSREIEKHRNYNFYKRWNNNTNSNDYFVAFSDTLYDSDFKVVPTDNYGRIKLIVPKEVIEDSILASMTIETNVEVKLIDVQHDGKVYQLDI